MLNGNKVIVLFKGDQVEKKKKQNEGFVVNHMHN